ncbi:MAG: CRISPR system precrRNA processing endoribonuclease RAMP protein Cas6 [Bacteroidales bacterium]|nr:CRISPR system precrRNA processing endoribonuclease RAMP protein Cas6 [Bacteroidales bacterium]
MKTKPVKDSSYLIPDGFRLYRLRFLFRVAAPVSIPEKYFPADVISGAFGQALKKTVCLMHSYPSKQMPCGTCMLLNQCAFPKLMALPGSAVRPLPRKYRDHPKPFVISAPHLKHKYSADETLTFDMTLVGDSLEYLADILRAMTLMGADGVGRQKPNAVKRNAGHPLVFTMASAVNGAGATFPLYANGSLLPGVEPIPWTAEPLEKAPNRNKKTEIALLTPLSLPEKHAGDFSLNHLVKIASSRIQLLSYLYCGTEMQESNHTVTDDEGVEPDETVLQEVSYACSSRRYDNRYRISGNTGLLTFGTGISRYLALLRTAGIIHIGLSTSAGFGHFSIHQPPE